MVDRIFTRVGASDDLARGQSTFMVEMNETANIVEQRDRASLVILDEIGRGTSTFDGLSIAWSVAEFLHDKIKAARSLRPHYHELTKLARAQWRGELQCRSPRMERADHFPAQDHPGRRGQELRNSRGTTGGRAKGNSDRAKDILAHLEKPNGAVVHTKAKRKKSAQVLPQAEKPQLDLLAACLRPS